MLTKTQDDLPTPNPKAAGVLSEPGSARTIHSTLLFREPPDVGLAPTAVWRVPTHPPPLQLEDPSLTTTLPSPPSPSLFPPTPLALFAMLREGAAQAGVGEGSLSRKGWRGRAVQAALRARPTSVRAQLLQPQTVTLHKHHTPESGRTPCKGSTLAQFLVNFSSVFGQK